jgi:hypothetical protein
MDPNIVIAMVLKVYVCNLYYYEFAAQWVVFEIIAGKLN